MKKVRIDVTIEEKVLTKFRKRFVNKKGDLSKVVQELIVKKLKNK